MQHLLAAPVIAAEPSDETLFALRLEPNHEEPVWAVDGRRHDLELRHLRRVPQSAVSVSVIDRTLGPRAGERTRHAELRCKHDAERGPKALAAIAASGTHRAPNHSTDGPGASEPAGAQWTCVAVGGAVVSGKQILALAKDTFKEFSDDEATAQPARSFRCRKRSTARGKSSPIRSVAESRTSSRSAFCRSAWCSALRSCCSSPSP